VLGRNWTGTMDFDMRLQLVTTDTFYHKVVGYWSSIDGELFVFDNISRIAAKPTYKIAIIQVSVWFYRSIYLKSLKTNFLRLFDEKILR
jgi:hypothetical protein